MNGFSATFRFKATPEQSAELWSVLANLATTRACRTCAYGDDPACGHEQRAERVCVAPVGDSGCAAMPCLGSCSTPRGAS